MARKTFKFRLYPNRQQRDKLTATLDVCRELYNAGLQERIEAWRIARQSGATTRLTNCRTSNRFEKMSLASFHKCCKIRCVVWTRPTKRSSVESSVGKKLDSRGSKDATVTTVSRIRKADSN